MTRLLRDVDPLVAAVLDGDHDDILAALNRACTIRAKRAVQATGIRPKSRVRITEEALERAPDMVGREGIVVRVNPKTVSVTLDPLDDDDYRTDWLFPHAWLEPAPKKKVKS